MTTLVHKGQWWPRVVVCISAVLHNCHKLVLVQCYITSRHCWFATIINNRTALTLSLFCTQNQISVHSSIADILIKATHMH